MTTYSIAPACMGPWHGVREDGSRTLCDTAYLKQAMLWGKAPYGRNQFWCNFSNNILNIAGIYD